MKTSICITVFNEEKTIGPMLEALLSQTVKPDEIVIVDGGSRDKTVEIVKHYQKKERKIKLLIEKGSIAHGRNTSIEIAKNKIIALTDAGCVAKKDWLEKITMPFKNEGGNSDLIGVNFVAGFYKMTGETSLQAAAAVFHGVPPARFNPSRFVPSARSMAFRKKVWEEIGGFRENLERAGEDTLFNYEVLKKGYRIVKAKDAIVEWEVPKSLGESIKKFFYYAKGDGQAGIWWNPTQQVASHNIKISLIYFRYLIGLIILGLVLFKNLSPLVLLGIFVAYLFWSIWKWRDVIKDWPARFWLPILQISSDWAVMIGFVSGLRR
jgi:glycosyltransferase involved in cell wall biosynthesis